MMNEEQEKSQIQDLIKTALGELEKERPQLRLDDRRIGERALVARIAFWMEHHLPEKWREDGFKIDVEYDIDSEGNRKFLVADPELETAAKKVRRKIYRNEDGRDQVCVIPDIILHKRGAGQGNNKTVVEVKFIGDSENEITYAKLKLKAFQGAFSNYSHGVLLSLPNEWGARFVDSCSICFQSRPK
jgi:hypothetical protein